MWKYINSMKKQSGREKRLSSTAEELRRDHASEDEDMEDQDIEINRPPPPPHNTTQYLMDDFYERTPRTRASMNSLGSLEDSPSVPGFTDKCGFGMETMLDCDMDDLFMRLEAPPSHDEIGSSVKRASSNPLTDLSNKKIRPSKKSVDKSTK